MSPIALRSAVLLIALSCTTALAQTEGDAEGEAGEAEAVTDEQGRNEQGGDEQGRDEQARARALFEQAMPLLHARSYVEARDLLRDSLALYAHSATAYNLAMVQRELGAATTALQLTTLLLAGEYGSITEEERTLIHELRGHVEGDIARITVEIDGAEDATVLIDDEEHGPASASPFAANPGDHVVRVASETHLVQGDGDATSVTLRRGEEITLRFALSPRPEPLLDEPPPRARWVVPVVVLVVLAIGGGAAAAYFVAKQGPDPEIDPIFGRTETLVSF